MTAAAAWALACTMPLAGGCGDDLPPLPEPAGAPADPAASGPAAGTVAGPEVPGRSEEFERMEVPPGQLARAIPAGDAWGPEDGPAYRSLCLQCHSVSQTSFAVTDWRESLHARAGIGCAACHGTHEAVFVTRPGPDRCLLCHAQQTEEFLRSAHGPERAPGMGCVSCHDAHATDRRLASATALCSGCHLDSGHVQEFAASRMGVVLASCPPAADGSARAPDCITCHQPESAVLRETGDFRNDRVTLHDPGLTVARSEGGGPALARDAIELLVPVCVPCHSERNARHRLENSDPLLLHWTPVGAAPEVRRGPAPEVAP
jgi:predicted CXXCH cytochrome family protein